MISLQVIFARILSNNVTTKAVAAIRYARALAVITLGRYLPWLTFVDTAKLDDSAELNVTKVIADSILFQDSPDIEAGKSAFEVVTTQDSGEFYSQGYCAFNYFASDYVGEIRTF